MNNGLQRFDRLHYKTFRHNKTASISLPENSIVYLLLDKDSNLGIVTLGDYVGISDQNRFTYHNIPVKPRRMSSILPGKKLIGDKERNFFAMAACRVVTIY